MADLTKEHDVEKLVDTTIKEYGKLDVLVNNAATYEPSSIKDSNILEQFDKDFNINIRSIVELTHLSIPYLEKSKGTIITLSDIGVFVPVRNKFQEIINLLKILKLNHVTLDESHVVLHCLP